MVTGHYYSKVALAQLTTFRIINNELVLFEYFVFVVDLKESIGLVISALLAVCYYKNLQSVVMILLYQLFFKKSFKSIEQYKTQIYFYYLE